MALTEFVIGVDEAGRGPVLGPLVVTAVAIPRSRLAEVADRGIKDSKLLKSAKRRELNTFLADQFQHAIEFVTSDQLNQEMGQKSLNIIEVDAFARAINRLKLPSLPEIQLDACDVNAGRFGQRVNNRLQNLGWRHTSATIRSEHRADSQYIAVAAASIIAKTNRDRQVQVLEEEIGQPLGSGYPSDPVTVNFLKCWIEEKGSPPPGSRYHWKTVQRLLVNRNQRKLDAF